MLWLYIVGYIQATLRSWLQQEGKRPDETPARPTDMRQRDPLIRLFIYVAGYIGLSRLFLASYNKKARDQMRPQLGNKPTDKRQTDMRQRDPLLPDFYILHVVGYTEIGLSRLFLARHKGKRP